ncbi:hypothetical protein ACOMHN_052620 [Nucella lapillus]
MEDQLNPSEGDHLDGEADTGHDPDPGIVTPAETGIQGAVLEADLTVEARARAGAGATAGTEESAAILDPNHVLAVLPDQRVQKKTFKKMETELSDELWVPVTTVVSVVC